MVNKLIKESFSTCPMIAFFKEKYPEGPVVTHYVQVSDVRTYEGLQMKVFTCTCPRFNLRGLACIHITRLYRCSPKDNPGTRTEWRNGNSKVEHGGLMSEFKKSMPFNFISSATSLTPARFGVWLCSQPRVVIPVHLRAENRGYMSISIPNASEIDVVPIACSWGNVRSSIMQWLNGQRNNSRVRRGCGYSTHPFESAAYQLPEKFPPASNGYLPSVLLADYYNLIASGNCTTCVDKVELVTASYDNSENVVI